VLLYPSNLNFQKPLDDFIYEGELVLSVLPINLKNSLSQRDEQKELNEILGSINKTTTKYLPNQNFNMAAEEKSAYGNS
jgi:stage III sporulation protein SpoIIIAA